MCRQCQSWYTNTFIEMHRVKQLNGIGLDSVTFGWRKGNETLVDFSVEGIVSSVRIQAFEDNFGMYSCYVNNSIGAGIPCEADVQGKEKGWLISIDCKGVHCHFKMRVLPQTRARKILFFHFYYEYEIYQSNLSVFLLRYLPCYNFCYGC